MEIEILNYFVRESDNNSYILYKGQDGGKHLTNGVCIWSKNLEEKIRTLETNWEDVDLNRIFEYLKEHYPYAGITEYLEKL